MRNIGCQLIQDVVYKQYRTVILENEKLQIWLLLDRGAEPIRWLHKPSNTDLIWKSRLGLQPPHALFPDYQMTYPGGWQEMIPEISYTHTYRGTVVHRGEAAVTPWEMQIIVDEPEMIHVRCTQRLRSLPLLITKDFMLKSGQTLVRIEESIRNEAPVQMETNWGHHLAYGAPLIDPAARISFSEGAIIKHPQTGEEWSWPHAMQDGMPVDLSRLPEAGTPRDLLAVETVDGAYRIDSIERKLALEVRWDRSVWPYVWYWQNFAADEDAPFFACEYNLGLEMCNVMPKLTLAEAAERGVAIVLQPGETVSSWLEFEVKEAGKG